MESGYEGVRHVNVGRAQRYALGAAIALGGLIGHALGRCVELAADEAWENGFHAGYGARSAVTAAAIRTLGGSEASVAADVPLGGS